MYCDVELVCVQLTIKRNACTGENLKNQLRAKTIELDFYYKRPFVVNDYLFKTLSKAAEALIKSTFVPSLLAASRDVWVLILPEGWKTRLFQLIERVQRTGEHSVVVGTSRETESVKVLLALEVASRISFSRDVVLESNSILVEEYVQRAREHAKKLHDVRLKLTHVRLNELTPVKVTVKTKQRRA